MEAQLATLNATLGQICGKLDAMERAIHEHRVENSAVREELAAARITIMQKDEAIQQLTENVNRIDQASRANTLRIFGLPITNTTPTASIPNIIFKEIIAPVLAHAVEAGDLPATPPPAASPCHRHSLHSPCQEQQRLPCSGQVSLQPHSPAHLSP
jgi:hypothetical protein